MVTKKQDSTTTEENQLEEKKQENKQERIKEMILKNTNVKSEHYNSDKFKKIEQKVKDSIKDQKTDDALRGVTVGALVVGSSDIHYEIFEKYVVVRFRIDGVLVDIFRLTSKEYKYIVERLKYSAGLKLNITNVPQDGKYSLLVEEKKLDVRVSTIPTKYGENVVCRVLDSSKAIVDFSKLGFFWTSKRILEKAISKNNGMILVTGPTGSGKTTTLYTILSRLNTREKKVVTLEDPIEYEMDGIIQSEVDESKGYDFGLGLKALMRQDPDVIMVGEIRDRETLDTATTASLTGHLVLSTLHTKSAAETLDRIINMGLKPYVLAAALDVIIAQRLVRKICKSCKVEKEKTDHEQQIVKTMMKDTGMSEVFAKNIKLYEGKGCDECGGSGYSGRVGVFEIISLNDNLRDLIRDGANTRQIIEEARKGDLITMKEDGILKAMRGYTTIEEILRVV